MKPCWVCGRNVKPDTRPINCELCHGRVVTPTEEEAKKMEEHIKKLKEEEREYRKRKEFERMMSSKDTYERRNGAIRQKRHSR